MARPTDKGLISKAKLTAIGDAIRGKTGGSAALTPDQMATAIAEIKSDPKLQEKTITPSALTQIAVPDSDYDGLSKVVVSGDADLVPENIAKGINIFGVTGTMAGGEGDYYWSKSDTDGNFIAYVVSDQPDEFPEDGTLDGYYYKLQQGSYDDGVASAAPKEMVSATAQASVNRNGSGTPTVNCDFEPMFAYAYGPNTVWGSTYASAAAWRTSPTSGWTQKTANGNAIAINGRQVSCTFSCGDNAARTAYIFVVGYPD